MRRGLASRLAAAAALAGTALAGTALASIAIAGTAQPEAGLLAVTDQSTAVALDGEFTMRLRVTGAPAGATMAVEVHDRVTTRIGFARSLEAEGLRRRLRQIGPAPLASFGAVAGELQVRLPLGAGSGALRLAGAGVYPVVVTVRDTNDATFARIVSHLVALGTPAAGSAAVPPLDVAVVLPVGGGEPATAPDGSVGVDRRTRDQVAALSALLRSHPGVPLTIVPVPETLDALAAAADGAAVVDSLASGTDGRQISASTYVPVETEGMLDAGLGDELGEQLDRGTAVVAARVGRPDGRTWITDPSAGPDSVTWLRARGVDQLVVPEASLEPLDDRLFPVTLTQTFLLDGVPGMRAAVADGSLAAHAGDTGDPVLDAHHLLADLVVLYLDQPGASRGVVVHPPGASGPPVPFLDTLLQGLTDIRVLAPVTLDTLFADVPTAGARGQTDGRAAPLTRRIDPEPAQRLGGFAAALRDARADIATLAAAVGAANPLPAALGSRLLVAGHEALSNTERARYVTGVRDSVRGAFAAVDIPERQAITLTARSGRVPLLVRNDAGYPVTVLIRLRSEKLSFPDEPDLELPLTLVEETTRVELRVRARASGSSPLLISVWSPDGRLELGETRYTVRSTAFSGVGLVLSIGALGFLVAWWARSARRTLAGRRSDARGRHPVTPGPPDESQ